MKIIAHLSDLHFGRTSQIVVDHLRNDLNHLAPDLIVISGDFTQRAKYHQFQAARDFVDSLPAPVLAVPGNHDLMPFHRPLSRIFRPHARFERHLGHVERACLSDDFVVAGLDSTRHLRWKSGEITQSDLSEMDKVLSQAIDNQYKIIFLHHPPESSSAKTDYQLFIDRDVDLILTGHVHKAAIRLIPGSNGNAILVQASTACSTRLRGHANGFAVIRLHDRNLHPDGRVQVDMRGWDGHAFHTASSAIYEKKGRFWHPYLSHHQP